MIHKDKKYEYMGLRTFFKTRQLMDMDLIFRTFPEEYFPFDYDTYFASETEVEYGCTDCHTGRPVFLSEKQDKDRLMDILRASCAMPGAVRPVLVDGKPYVDGGLSDSIPVKRAFEMGCDKVVVIQTRGRKFRMKPSRSTKLIARAYGRYPAIGEDLRRRPVRYNKNLAYIRRMEQAGKVLAIRPCMPEVGRMEKDYKKLMTFYRHGYILAQEQFAQLQGFMGGKR